MTNDNKTLADVRPGGRVRLEDQADAASAHDMETIERVAKAMQASEQKQSGWTWADCSPIEVEGWMDLARAAVAALSTQPSPGGQDALAEALADDVETCVSDACGYLASDSGWDDYGIYRDDAAERYRALPDRIRALAARQPVRIYGCCAQPEGELHTAECPNMRHPAARQPGGDQHADDLAVDAFAAAMKAKMAAARAKGRGGWEDPAQCSADGLSRMLRDHVEKGDPRDVANFCMMLHQRGESISARQPVGEP
ncbi:hypothetical protein ACLPGS_10260 [Stenotrophomonas maltophilia]|uniref:hypothetical protein n=1 Tax=Stenotrophomonas maltophilia TaxID=40324 RepID=UPI003D2BCDC7